jgi:hypothetical protein
MSDPDPATLRQQAQPAPDRWQARLRETIAAAIAGCIVLGTLVLIGIAVAMASSAETFGRVKDLLLFVNPLVGYVIGYYFNKVSTEARAENAEAVARDSSQAAVDAMQARGQAEVKAEEATGSLADLEQAAAKLVPQPRAGTLGDAGDGAQRADPELLAALSRARRVLRRPEPVP